MPASFCSRCGQPTEMRVPDGEDRERQVCAACGAIHYQNPKMVVGCIVEHDSRVLMCKRAIQPRRGYWTVPAGFLELGESAMQGAVRETLEEARASVGIVAPYAHVDVPHIGQAYIIYRAQLLEPSYGPGPESECVELMSWDEIPWDALAFPVVRYALALLREDKERGTFRTHQARLVREASGYALHDHLALSLA